MDVINEIIELAETVDERMLPIAKYSEGNLNSISNKFVNAKYNNILTTFPLDTYSIVKDNMLYDPFYEFMSIIVGYKNIYMQNCRRGDYKYKFNNGDYGEENINKIVQYIRNTPKHIASLYTGTHQVDSYLDTYMFTFQKLINYCNVEEVKYSSVPKKTTYNSSKSIKDVYALVKIPRDIMKLFYSITKNFTEVKRHLILNDVNGYYSYKCSGNILVPIVCKHIYMALENVSPKIISEECYKDGICKYCKQDLINYNVTSETGVSSRITSLIYVYLDMFEEKISAVDLLFKLQDMISTGLQYNKIAPDDVNASEAFGSIYMYYIYKNTTDVFTYKKHRVLLFLRRISDVCASNGWNEEKVADIISDTSLFASIHDIIIILKTCIYEDVDNEFNAILPENILFGDTTSRKIENHFQKIYTSGVKYIYEYNILFNDIYLNYWNNIIETSINIPYKHVDISLNVQKNDIGLVFFKESANYYCPENLVHEWKNNSCKHCKLEKNLKNLVDVYLDYHMVINDKYTDKPKTIRIDNTELKNTYMETLKDINSILEADFDNMFNIHSNTYGTEITRGMKVYNINMMRILSSCLNIDMQYIDWSETLIKKACCWLFKNNILSTHDIVDKLVVAYVDRPSIILL